MTKAIAKICTLKCICFSAFISWQISADKYHHLVAISYFFFSVRIRLLDKKKEFAIVLKMTLECVLTERFKQSTKLQEN